MLTLCESLKRPRADAGSSPAASIEHEQPNNERACKGFGMGPVKLDLNPLIAALRADGLPVAFDTTRKGNDYDRDSAF